jgi:hypothetical protein
MARLESRRRMLVAGAEQYLDTTFLQTSFVADQCWRTKNLAQNTASVQHGNLTIKYSPEYPISETQAHKLSRSLELACVILKSAIKQITPICNGVAIDKAGNLKTTLEILDYHFFQNSPIKRESKEVFWRGDVIKITHNFRRIQCALQCPVVIADAYSSTVLNALEKTKADISNDKLMHAELGWTWDMSDEEYVGKLNSARRVADTEAMMARGYVAAKRATIQELNAKGLSGKYKSGALATPIGPAERLLASGVAGERVPNWMTPQDPRLQVELAAEQLGSIHINFRRMLRAEDPLSDSMVARTIIHEASHKYVSTHDFAYAGDDDYERLDRRQSLLNADSYAFAAASLARNRLFKNDMDMKFADAGF